MRRSTRTLRIAWIAATLLTVALAVPDLIALALGDLGPAWAPVESSIAELATGQPDVVAAVGGRFLTWLLLVGAGAIGWIASPQILLGFGAARHRILDEPGEGLGGRFGSAGMALFAVGVWLVTVVAAYGLERRGVPGPAELILRRLSYRRGG